MDKYIKLDTTYLSNFIQNEQVEAMQKEVDKARRKLKNGTGPGSDFLGWVELPIRYDKDEFKRIQQAARKIRKQSKILIVIGIGGSYLGAKSAIDMLKPYFETKKRPEVIFAGQNMSATYLAELIEYVQLKDFSINVISKSGTTTEPAIAFRLLKKALEDKYGTEAAKERIYVTTDQHKGALRTLSTKNGYETFVVPDNIGGRFSVLTAVGLLPIAAAGIDIRMVMKGAKAARSETTKMSVWENDAHLYAAIRNLLYRQGYTVEMLVNYEPSLITFSEWWKQLYGESEGKDSKGLFVASASFSTDLHSLGQYIQEGNKILFETVIRVEKPIRNLAIETDADNLDELNYLVGKSVDEVNQNAFLGTILAHEAGNVPNLVLTVPEINAVTLGYLFYFFELACGVSGYLLGVNPFDQPGVEAYKKNMFALLGKPGYSDLKQKLIKK